VETLVLLFNAICSNPIATAIVLLVVVVIEFFCYD